MARPGAVSRSQRDCDRMGKAGGDGDEWPEACDAKRRGSRRPLGGGRFRGTNSLGRRNGLRRWDGEGGGRRRRQPERLLAKDGHARDGIWQASVRGDASGKGGTGGRKGAAQTTLGGSWCDAPPAPLCPGTAQRRVPATEGAADGLERGRRGYLRRQRGDMRENPAETGSTISILT